MEPSNQPPPEDQPDPVDLQLDHMQRDISAATSELDDVIKAARERAERLDRYGRKTD